MQCLFFPSVHVIPTDAQVITLAVILFSGQMAYISVSGIQCYVVDTITRDLIVCSTTPRYQCWSQAACTCICMDHWLSNLGSPCETEKRLYSIRIIWQLQCPPVKSVEIQDSLVNASLAGLCGVLACRSAFAPYSPSLIAWLSWTTQTHHRTVLSQYCSCHREI